MRRSKITFRPNDRSAGRYPLAVDLEFEIGRAPGQNHRSPFMYPRRNAYQRRSAPVQPYSTPYRSPDTHHRRAGVLRLEESRCRITGEPVRHSRRTVGIRRYPAPDKHYPIVSHPLYQPTHTGSHLRFVLLYSLCKGREVVRHTPSFRARSHYIR